MKKYSFLSLLLVSASGTIAALLPAKKADANSSKLFLNGILQATTGTAGEAFTCNFLAATGGNCDYSITVGKVNGVSGTTDGLSGGATSITSGANDTEGATTGV